MNITLDEWRNKTMLELRDLASAVSQRVRTRPCGLNGFSLEVNEYGDLVSVSLEADLRHPADAFAVSVNFGRVVSHGMTLTAARYHHTALQLLLEAAEIVAATTEGLVVWMPGLCPCSQCGTNGIDSFTGKTCSKCNGAGKR